ncbi:cellulose biosynthesis protein BcsQ [Chitinimonas sp.]|uniref:cellulose biosynthesis protein BcsQ n=1 Tax=Chitinimonas sp. TaxID=1934313 RepID=UPI0035AFD8CD
MPRLSLQSPLGGVGRTTLLAHLAQAFQRSGRPVLAVDFNPQGHLALHLGLAPDEADGLLPRWTARQDWAQAGFSLGDIRLLPFGRASAATLRHFEQTLLDDSDWLSRQLDRLALPADTVILIDSPALPSCYARQAAQAADVNVGVLRPDALAPLAVRQLDAWLNDDVTGATAALLVNGVDASCELPSAVLGVLRDLYRDRVAPNPVHLDSAIAEALAADSCVFDYAPHSQASHDLYGLARWLLARLDAMVEISSPVASR